MEQDYLFDQQSFRCWLKNNRHTASLSGATPVEVAHLAHYVGFDWPVIYDVLSHFEDAMRGSSFDRRVDMQIKIEIGAIDRQAGKVNLARQWSELYDYHMTGKEFRESA